MEGVCEHGDGGRLREGSDEDYARAVHAQELSDAGFQQRSGVPLATHSDSFVWRDGVRVDANSGAAVGLSEAGASRSGRYRTTRPIVASRRNLPPRAAQAQPVLLRDDLPRVIFKHRQSLALMAILDVIGLLVLLLQLTTGGFPQNVDDAGMRFDGKLVEEVWFSVILAASFFPVAGFVGAVAKWRAALWVYALYLVSAIGGLSRRHS